MVWTVGREGREIKHMDMSVLSRSLTTPGIDALFFCPGWWFQPGQKAQVPVGATNRDEKILFCPGWWLQPGQKAPDSPPAGLAVGPGIKTPFGPGSNGSRDKKSGTKVCCVVVTIIDFYLD